MNFLCLKFAMNIALPRTAVSLQKQGKI